MTFLKVLKYKRHQSAIIFINNRNRRFPFRSYTGPVQNTHFNWSLCHNLLSDTKSQRGNLWSSHACADCPCNIAPPPPPHEGRRWRKWIWLSHVSDVIHCEVAERQLQLPTSFLPDPALSCRGQGGSCGCIQNNSLFPIIAPEAHFVFTLSFVFRSRPWPEKESGCFPVLGL